MDGTEPPARVAKDSEELLRLIEEDELQDQAAREYMRINDYARLRGIAPQRVHYYIRTRKLKKFTCACGSFVVNVHAADLALGFAEEKGE